MKPTGTVIKHPSVAFPAAEGILDERGRFSSPTNVGMEVVYFNGRNQPGLLFNGGWLWDLQQGGERYIRGVLLAAAVWR